MKTVDTMKFVQVLGEIKQVDQRKDRENEELDGEVVALRQEVEDKTRMVLELEGQVANQSRQLDSLQSRLDSLSSELSQYHAHSKQQDTTIADLTAQVSQLEPLKLALIQAKSQLKEQQAGRDRLRDVEMAEFRMLTAAEANQVFAAKVQKITSEHQLTVSKLMDALMERQKQEHRLIEMLKREREKGRKLIQKVRDGGRVGEGWDVSVQCVSFSVEDKVVCDGYAQTSVVEMNVIDSAPVEEPVLQEAPASPLLQEAPASPLLQEASASPVLQEAPAMPLLEKLDEVKLEGDECEAPNTPKPLEKPLFFALQFAFEHMAEPVTVVKLDSKGRLKMREIWLRNTEPFLRASSATSLDLPSLSLVTVHWSTTSSLKREVDTFFSLKEVQTVSTGQGGPLFGMNIHVRDRSSLSLWVRYRRVYCFSVIFDDKRTMARWAGGLVLAVMLLNTQNPRESKWRPVMEMMVGEGGLKEPNRS